jgi:hypothetical protein
MRLFSVLLIVPAFPLLGCGSSGGGTTPTPGAPSATGGAAGAAVATGGSTAIVAPGAGGSPPVVAPGAGGSPPVVAPGAGGTTSVLPATGGTGGVATGTAGAAGSGTGGADTGPEVWAPAAPADGYTRIIAQTVTAIPPGGDITQCQYLQAPLDHDVDIVAVLGFQSRLGHHATAFEYTPKPGETVGTNFPCMGTEFNGDLTTLSAMGAFVGAVGLKGQASSSSLPDGVAFRHKAGKGVMLSVHYLNTGLETGDGNAVLDLKMVPTDPARTIATMFTNVGLNINLPPSQQTTTVLDCPVQETLSFLMVSNHMHDYGIKAFTQVIHPDGTTQDLHTDNSWSNDQQFNPVYSHFPLATPVVVHSGDTIRTSCTWDNTSSVAVAFPREMCTSAGFILSTRADGSVPMCMNGAWLAQSL